MQDFEKLGVFYLGRGFDMAAGRATDDLMLYDARDLTTHAVCVGMTGSGKTGLGVTLLEEAAIDGIPALVIDPKGDLGSLLLTFPGLQAGDFLPWVDEAEAARNGCSPSDYAARVAAAWRKGLADWGQAPERIARLQAAAETVIYTPGSSAGRPINVLQSLAVPTGAQAADPTALRDRIMSAASGLLGLLGLPADPIQSREHILVSNILQRAWQEGRGLDIAGLIQQIQKPPFDRVGVFDLETFFPARDRLALAMTLNNLLASPGFSAWMEGEPLDIQRLLYTADGRPRVAVLSIAHLSDAERMFFVTILLNEVVAWMRRQSGTGSLRAILYMDEIFGYFPPTAMPPSKTPMLTLLKQARAYGLGVVLATQNPVDLDYKGLSNAGTWFIGRLQTDRDRARILEGLEGVLAGAGATLDRAATDATLAGLGNRVFLMRNVHEDRPAVFQSRWALSYLRGPLTLPQIQRLVTAGPAAPTTAASAVPAFPAVSAFAAATPPAAPVAPAPAQAPVSAAQRPPLPPEVPEFFVRAETGGTAAYQPRVLGVTRLHYVDAKAGVDAWQTTSFLAPLSPEGHDALWAEAERGGDLSAQLSRSPASPASFGPLPAPAANARSYDTWKKMLVSHIYQNVVLDLFSCPAAGLVSRPGEAEGEFKARVAQALREKRDLEVEKLRRKYAPKLTALEDRVRRAADRVEREKSQYGQQKMQTAISFGATLLGAFLGRKAVSTSSLGRATTAVRGISRAAREKEDIGRAEESAEVLNQRLATLQAEFDQEAAAVQAALDAAGSATDRMAVRPRKSDIEVTTVGLAWCPGA